MSSISHRSSTTEANPNVSGKDSTSSLTSAGSDGSTSSSSDIEGDFTELEDHTSAEDEFKHNLVSLKVSKVDSTKKIYCGKTVFNQHNNKAFSYRTVLHSFDVILNKSFNMR